MNFRSRQGEARAGFPMAPMIDVVFILLSFFIATQIFARWEKEIDIQLPTADSSQAPARLPGEIILNVLPDGGVVVNRQRHDEDGLRTLLTRLVETFPGQPVIIRADRRTAYEYVVNVLDLCRQVDIWNISFATDAVEAGSAPVVRTAD